MNVLARIVRFLFWLLVLSWGIWLLRRIFGWMLQNAASSPMENGQAPSAMGEPQPGNARRLVRDPFCGVFVDETLSIPLRDAGEKVHFCSTGCRDAYMSSTKKFAANA